MKEFKKWSKTEEGLKERGSDYAEGKAAWKAALEWALKNLEEQYEHTARGDTGWEGKFIEKELSGE